MESTLTASTPLFNDPKNGSIRLWHWLVFLCFACSLTTVLLASTLFRTGHNIQMVQDQVTRNGGSVTMMQALRVSHAFNDLLWTWHKYFGYGLCCLFLWRVLAEAASAKEGRLGARIRKALALPGGTGEKGHYLFVQYLYLGFYALLLAMCLTGLAMAFDNVPWVRPLHGFAKKTHALVQYGIYTYIALHLIGVIRADLTKHKGIVSRMIHGQHV